MNSIKRREIAKTTLEIIEKRYYSHNNSIVEVTDSIRSLDKETYLFRPGQEIESKNFDNGAGKQTELVFLNCTTIEAIKSYSGSGKILALNFASAKNPGGGFLNGAQSQEESLARASSLYYSLQKGKEMYDFNRSQDTYLYSDYMIYSPNVLFWMDDNGDFLESPISVDIITSPAPNLGAMMNHKKLDEIDLIEETLKRRIDIFCQQACNERIEILILGAWGCGVFRNDPELVAKCFYEVINLKYMNSFKKIVFATWDRSEEKFIFNTFKKVFAH